ncbi:hypothetical protein [Neptunicella sp. SCSIO 80796]|uniref:hypothetical protein n=1 Tax=Neptunicella plasticusilytica TaxID=3117012 RepID=UPI003A4DEB22
MNLHFSPPIADARHYPSPSVLALPKHTSKDNGEGRKLPSSVKQQLLVDHGRTALFLIAKTLHTQQIWLPSYHCPALVEPFIAANKQVNFYPVLADLSPDLRFLLQHIKQGDALVAIRFFGFDCQIQELADLCNSKQCLLIEDLAHAAFFDRLIGQLAITSLIKFYPVNSGAEILIGENSSNQHSLLSLHQKLPGLWTKAVRTLLIKVKRKLGIANTDKRFRYFDPNSFCRQLSQQDHQQVRHSDQQDIIRKRCDNYQFMAKQLIKSVMGKPLFPVLQENTVPYVLPFLLDDPVYFDQIRQAGIQIYRWEEIASSDCAISQEYRTRLIQLPVHQDLTRTEMDYMINVLTSKMEH